MHSDSSFGSRGNQVFSRQDQKGLMYGASLGARFPSLPQTVFTLTALRLGDPHQDVHNLAYISTLLVDQTGSRQFSRFDVELLAQTTIPKTTANWIVGGRVEHFAARDKYTSLLYTPSGSALTLSGTVVEYARNVSNIYSGKLGVGNYLPISEDGKHRLFGNIMGTAGVQTNEEQITGAKATVYRIGVDASLGYQYIFDPSWALDIRYRFLTNYLIPTAGDHSVEVNQGPIAGLTYRW